MLRNLFSILCICLFASLSLADGLTPVAWQNLRLGAGERFPEYYAGPNGDLFVATSKNTSTTTVDAILRRIDEKGRLAWTKTFTNANVVSVAQDEGGDLYVAGPQFLRKFAPDGTLLWAKEGFGYFPRVYSHPLGGVYIVSSAVPSGNPTRLSRVDAGGAETHYFESPLLVNVSLKIVSPTEVYAYRDGLIRRIGGAGELLWEKQWDPSVQLENGFRTLHLDSFGDTIRGDYISYATTFEERIRGIGNTVSAHTFVHRVTGAAGQKITTTDYHQGSTEASGEIGIAALTPNFYFFADRTFFSGASNNFGPLDRERFDYLGNRAWATEGPDLTPTWGVAFRDDFFWWAGARYERVRFDGAILGAYDSGFDLSQKPLFLTGKNSIWIVGKQGETVRIVRFDGRLRADRDDYQTEPNTPLTVEAAEGVLANDEFAFASTVVLEQQPKNGTVQLNQDGSFTYTPNAGFKGYDDIYYYFEKSGERSNTAIAAIAVGTFAYKHTIAPNSIVGGNSATGTVTLNEPAPAGGLQVTLQSTTSAITVPASVTVPQGATTATYPVATKGVGETVTRSVIASGGFVPLHAVVQLKKAEFTSITVNPSSVPGGTKTLATVTLNGNAGPAGAVFQVTDNSSALTTPSSVTIAPNQKTATFEVQTSPVSQPATRTISATYGVTRSVAVTITTPKLDSLTINPATIPGGTSATGKVTFVGTFTSDTSVALASSEINVPASVTVPAGSSTATFTVSADPTASTYTGTVSATHSATTKTAQITVRPAALAALQISPSTVVGGQSSVGTVVFDGKVASSTFVSLATNSSSVQVPANVVVLGGSSTATFEIKTSKVAATATRQVFANHNGIVRSSSITLTP